MAAAVNHTEQLVEAYKSGQVTQAVFYAIVNEMLQNSNTYMQQLGVMALNDSPSSGSFVLAAEELEKPNLPSSMESALRKPLRSCRKKSLFDAWLQEECMPKLFGKSLLVRLSVHTKNLFKILLMPV